MGGFVSAQTESHSDRLVRRHDREPLDRHDLSRHTDTAASVAPPSRTAADLKAAVRRGLAAAGSTPLSLPSGPAPLLPALPEAGTVAALLAAQRRDRVIELIGDATVESIGEDTLAGAGFAAAHLRDGIGESAGLAGSDFRRMVTQAAAPTDADARALESEASHAAAIFAPLPPKAKPKPPAQPASAVSGPPPASVDPRFVDDSSSEDEGPAGKQGGFSAASAHTPAAAGLLTADDRTAAAFDPYHDPRLVFRNSGVAGAQGGVALPRLATAGDAAPRSDAAGAPTAPLYAVLRVGHRVEALYPGDGRWYAGRIVSVTHGGYSSATYGVAFDGYAEVESGLGVDCLRALAHEDYSAAAPPAGVDSGQDRHADPSRRYAQGSFWQRLQANVLNSHGQGGGRAVTPPSTAATAAGQGSAGLRTTAPTPQPRTDSATASLPEPPPLSLAAAVEAAAACLADDAAVPDDGGAAAAAAQAARGAGMAHPSLPWGELAGGGFRCSCCSEARPDERLAARHRAAAEGRRDDAAAAALGDRSRCRSRGDPSVARGCSRNTGTRAP